VRYDIAGPGDREVRGRSLTGIAGSIPTVGIDFRLLRSLCVV
jgi:hypothetical protein